MVLTPCGFTSEEEGPFFCRGDNQIYWPDSFFKEMDKFIGGEHKNSYAFVFGCVVAHEFGHFLQNIAKTPAQKKAVFFEEQGMNYGPQLIDLENEADFLSGVWAHHVYKDNDLGITYADISAGAQFFQNSGNDSLLRKLNKPVNPKTFTHGAGKDRCSYFLKGFGEGNADFLFN